MKWTSEADAAIKKVPFFVRNKVRRRVEREAAGEGHNEVTLADVKATQKRFLNRMAAEIKGYQLDSCFGPNGCPHRANPDAVLIERIEAILKKADLLTFLKREVKGDLKFHHEFRITLADCPNACSQPQIKDIGVIGACSPMVTGETCTACEACIEACPDNAIALNQRMETPVIDGSRCMHCGRCVQVCPSGTIAEGARGYKILLGGKLGRHPKLARQLPGLYDRTGVLEIIEACLEFYKQQSRNGRRFADLIDEAAFDAFVPKNGK